MNRITQSMLNARLKLINDSANSRNSSFNLMLEGAYGKTLLYLVKKTSDKEYSVQRCLYTGTKSEVWDYLDAMLNTFTYLFDNGVNE